LKEKRGKTVKNMTVWRLIENECGMCLSHFLEFGLPTHAKGARLIYLPAYSLDFNSIVEAFSFIKLWLQRHKFLYTGPDQLLMPQAVNAGRME